LRSQIQTARERSDEIFSLLQPAALYERPIAERHRLVFYLGHLEAFEWNLICAGTLGMKSANPELDRLFAFGIDPTNGNLPQDSAADWPGESKIRSYVRNVRSAVDRCLDHGLEQATGDRTFRMAVEHRLMHVETLAYLVHGLPHSMKKIQHVPVITSMALPAPAQVSVPEGSATLGLERNADSFGWDNEYDAHTVHVPSFAIDVYNVTNGQYLEFVRAGGYEERSFWNESSWEWIKTSGIRHPKFWVPHGTGWRTRSMFADVPFQTAWPVYVSHAEAEAYCRWKGRMLPTEAQYHRAAFGARDGSEYPYPWGYNSPGRENGNFDFQHWDPAPVNAYPGGNSAFGIADLAGNGWEWTATPFAPFAGFESHPSYPGYSRDFFDGRHFVLKGASPRTSVLLLRRSFRNWFQPRYPHIYASFRCVQNV
jgi:ergothioneine biosynthesis protein EgtB